MKEKKIKKGFLFNPTVGVYNMLKALSKKNCRSMTGQLEFMIVKEYVEKTGGINESSGAN